MNMQKHRKLGALCYRINQETRWRDLLVAVNPKLLSFTILSPKIPSLLYAENCYFKEKELVLVIV